MQALPKALAARGHRVMVIAPRYKNYDDAWETGVRLRFRCFESEQEVGAAGWGGGYMAVHLHRGVGFGVARAHGVGMVTGWWGLGGQAGST